MVDGPLGRIIWRVVDAADYWLTQARLGRVDAVRGPVPPTVADEMRKAERDGWFSKVEPDPAFSCGP
jgi:hypothetical protein